MDLQRRFRLQNGPLQLPKEITAAHQQLRLFVAFLEQPATVTALGSVVSKLPREMRRQQTEQMIAAKSAIVIRVGIPHDRERLCRLISLTPQLRTLVWLARQIKDENVLPERAIPSYELMDLCTKVYQKWVEDLSRAK